MSEDTRKVLVGSITKVNTYHTDAYAIAVRNGFKGTEVEWLDSLSTAPTSALVELYRSEGERAAAEAKREQGESARQSAESNRSSAETARVANEQTRQSNESARVTQFASWGATIEGVKNDENSARAAADRAEAAADRAEAAAEKVVPSLSKLTLASQQNWYKGSISKEQITKINIVDSYAVTGNETETWNADANNTGSIKCYRNGTVVTIVGGGYGVIYANANSSNMFRGFTSLKIIVGLELLNTSNTTNANSMFRECHELRYVDVSKFDTHNFTDVDGMFRGCYKLKTIDAARWDLSNATNTNAMFMECFELEELITSGWNICKSTQLSSMFNHCDKLKSVDVSGWDTSHAVTIENMFYCCYSLEDIDVSNWDVSNVLSMSRAFEGCLNFKTLDMSNWNTSKVIHMNYIFESMVRLQTITLGANFKFIGANCYLPTPNSGYIPNANGRWKDTATSNNYSPVEVVMYHNSNNKSVTYEAMRA